MVAFQVLLGQIIVLLFQVTLRQRSVRLHFFLFGVVLVEGLGNFQKFNLELNTLVQIPVFHVEHSDFIANLPFLFLVTGLLRHTQTFFIIN